mgnify:CR=1 FL=1
MSVIPTITEETRDEAKRNPGGWVYAISGRYSDQEHVPPDEIIGAWKVDEHGEITGDFVPNPNFVKTR